MKTNFTKRLLGACRLAFMVVAMISTVGMVDATAQTCTVASNTTLDADCEATILVTAVAPSASVFYSVTLNGGANLVTPGDISVEVTEPGTYSYQVEDAAGCWGTFNVEDKSGPVCTVPTPAAATDLLATKYIECTVSDLTGILDTLTAANFEDCSGEITDVYFVDEEVTGCNPAIVGTELGMPLDGAIDPDGNDICAIYKRSWFAVDGQGKVSAEGCAQYVVALRSAAPPAITNLVTVECDDLENLSSLMAPKIASITEGADSIALTAGTKVCKYIATVNMGEQLPTCGDGYKQINEWSVIDWCEGIIVAEERQLVIVEDSEAPTDVTKGTVSFAADPFDCSGVITVGPATAEDNCSDALTWSTSISAEGGDGGHTGGSSDVSTVLATNGGTLANVAIGATVTVTWTAMDECGNMTTSMEEVFTGTIDNRAPTAVCNDQLNVTLVATNDGPRARIRATDVDNGSTDNCGISSIQISRDGVTYADHIDLTCTDQPSLTVYLRVTDNAATPNSNVCWTTISVEDKSVPVVTAPAAASVTCLEELPAVGTPTIVSQGCTAPTITYDGQTGGDLACGVGTVTRSWTVTPPAGSGGHTAATTPYKVTQTISIVKAAASWTAVFPSDQLDIECTTADPIPNALSLASILTDNACDDWLYDVQETSFSGTEGDECFKLVRTYTFVNWCTVGDAGKPAIAISSQMVDETTEGLNPVSGATTTLQAYGKFSFSQIFKVNDSTVPDASIAATPSCNLADDCNGGQIDVAVSDLADNCSAATVTAISISGNGVSRSVSGDDAVGGKATFADLPAGTYSITGTVRDGCGNQRVVSTEATVDGDCKKPTPYGVAVFTALMESDSVDVWVSDIETKSSDNCTTRDNLKFGIQLVTDQNGDNTLTEADVTGGFPTTQSVTLTCSQIGLAAAALWVMDEAGNMQFTIIPIASSDNDNSCNPPPADEAATVEGSIVDESDIEIDQVMVKFDGDKLSTFEQLFSGVYNYSVPMHSNVTITPEKNLGHANGVNAADIVVLQRHLLGITPLTSAYQLIAADVTNDGAVSARDQLHLIRLNLGIYDEFPNVTSWRFVDKSHTFVNPTSPWGFPEVINYADLSDDAQADFIGIKIGDLTGNAKPSQILGTEDNKVGAMTIAIDEAALDAGVTQEVEFTAKNFNGFAGYQFSIELAEGVTFEGVEVGSLPNHTEGNFGLNRLSEGVITTNWANAEALNLEDGEVLFTLSISSATTINVSEAINITSSVTAAEAYDNDLEVYDVDVQFNRTDAAFTLFQNTPNPFSNETIVGFNLPTAGAASLKVMDVSGRVIKSINGTYAAGFHQITLNKSDLGATGVLYYQLDTDAHSATKKMVIVE